MVSRLATRLDPFSVVSINAAVQQADLGKRRQRLLTFLLRLRAGDDPLDQAAPHQGFSGEARFLPFPRILFPARRWLNTIGIPQQTVDHLAIRLEGEHKPDSLEKGG